MKNINEYPYLTVITKDGRTEKIDNNIESVANAICKYGLEGDIIISTDDYGVLNTFGFYVDRCFDPHYMEELRPTLVKKQMEQEKIFLGGMDESSDMPSDEVQMG